MKKRRYSQPMGRDRPEFNATTEELLYQAEHRNLVVERAAAECRTECERRAEEGRRDEEKR